jgi:hypothetical protein
MSSPGPDPQRFLIVPHRPLRRIGWIFLAVLWPASLVLAWNYASGLAAPDLSGARGQLLQVRQLAREQAATLKELRQQQATLKRSDQISRDANVDLQTTLAEREEEISGLRADVDFYERLVGSTGQRHGLRVHEASFAPEAGGTWHYTVTLTQNLNRGAISKGEMQFSVEGVRAGKFATVAWGDLLQKPGAAGKPFSFRYFQQIEDSVMLPPGFKPQRVRVKLRGNGEEVEQIFPWQTGKTQGE